MLATQPNGQPESTGADSSRIGRVFAASSGKHTKHRRRYGSVLLIDISILALVLLLSALIGAAWAVRQNEFMPAQEAPAVDQPLPRYESGAAKAPWWLAALFKYETTHNRHASRPDDACLNLYVLAGANPFSTDCSERARSLERPAELFFCASDERIERYCASLPRYAE